MIAIVSLVLSLASSESEPPWQDLKLTIFEDPYVSSDAATICRVRVENRGSRTWSGSRLRFEAEALEGETAVERRRGRFGLTLGPRESLETVIGFTGRFRRFRVRLLAKESAPSSRGSRARGAKQRS